VDDDRTAVLVVRVWLEDGPSGFRGRLTTVGPSQHPDDVTVGLASAPEDVVEAVQKWLAGFLRQAPPPDRDT